MGMLQISDQSQKQLTLRSSCCLCSALKWCSTRVLEELWPFHLSFIIIIIILGEYQSTSVEKTIYTLTISLHTNFSEFLANTQKTWCLICTAEERAVHNEFDTERMTVKHTDRTSQDTDSCWYSLRNQMFSCSWCWSWCAAAVGNRPSSPAQNPRANRTIENEISETCKLDLPLYSTAYSILYIGVVEYYIQINK